MKKLIMAVAAVCAASCVCADEDGVPEGVNKVILKIAAVETPSTRVEKWNPPQVPVSAKALPFSESDIQGATPEEALKMDRANRQTRYENNRMMAEIGLRQYRDAMAHFKGTKAKLEGTAFGRQILVAVDKFAGAAGECFDHDCIEFFRNKVRTGLDGNTEVSRVVVGNGIVGEKNAPVEPDGAWVFVENFDPLTRSVFRWTSARVMETDNRSQFDKIKMTFQ